MRQYIVQPGDSPARIAAQMAGCPKCAVDLLAANPGKTRAQLGGGYETFASLGVGEVLALPDKWFDGTLDRLPQSYFDGLPAPTDGHLGAPVPHCHAFTLLVSVLQLVSPETAPDAISAGLALSPAGANVFVSQQPNAQGQYVVTGVWSGPGALTLDGAEYVDAAGSRIRVESVTDGGPASMKSGPCAPVSLPNPNVVRLPPPPPQYGQPQGHVPQQPPKPPPKVQPPSPPPAGTASSSSTGTVVAVVLVALGAGGALVYAASR